MRFFTSAVIALASLHAAVVQCLPPDETVDWGIDDLGHHNDDWSAPFNETAEADSEVLDRVEEDPEHFTHPYPHEHDTHCGELGVMRIDKSELPKGVDPQKVRKCLRHPEAIRLKLKTDHDMNLFEREWFTAGKFACSKHEGSETGYCTKKCGNNNNTVFCYGATEKAFGEWMTCTLDKDCDVDLQCGQVGCTSEECNCE